jgi:hypothetical protein
MLEALAADDALGDRVSEAVLEEEHALFVAQVPGSTTVGVNYQVAVERDGVVRNDDLPAPWTLGRSHLSQGDRDRNTSWSPGNLSPGRCRCPGILQAR